MSERPKKNRVRTPLYLGANSCISCGAEIPEGMLVCAECERGDAAVRCVICDKLLLDGESICPNCKEVLLHPKNSSKVILKRKR